jgi:hypothetical protein
MKRVMNLSFTLATAKSTTNNSPRRKRGGVIAGFHDVRCCCNMKVRGDELTIHNQTKL